MNFFLLLFSLVFPKSYYCSCIPQGPLDDKQYNEYNLIAIGKISKVAVENFKNTIYLTVKTYYKGGENKSLIKITAPRYESDCGIFPKVGERWMMFVYKDGPNYKTHLCTRSKNLNPKAWDYNKNEIAEDIKFLEAKSPKGGR